MFRFLTALILFVLTLEAFAQNDVVWSNVYGINYPTDPIDGAEAVMPAGNGDIIAVGTWNNGLGFVRVDSSGKGLVSVAYSSVVTTSVAHAICASGADTFMVAGERSIEGAGALKDLSILRMTGKGDIVWSKSYTTLWARPTHETVAPSGDGNFLVSASWPLFGMASGQPNTEIRLIKMTAQGDTLWTHSLSTCRNGVPYAMWAKQDSGVLVAGIANDSVFVYALDKSGEVAWGHRYSNTLRATGRGIAELKNGTIIVAATTLADTTVAGTSDSWILQLDKNGTMLRSWTKDIGGGNNDGATFVAPCDSCGFMVGGYASDRFNTGELWYAYCDAFSDTVSIRVFGNGNSLRNGTSLGNGAFCFCGYQKNDMYLIKVHGYCTDCNPVSVQRIPGGVLHVQQQTLSHADKNLYTADGRLVPSSVSRSLAPGSTTAVWRCYYRKGDAFTPGIETTRAK